MKKPIKIVYFGTPDFAVSILKELKEAGIVPTLIVTAPDKPSGRKLVLTPPAVKLWADENDIDTLQPEKLSDKIFIDELKNTDWDLFIVASYGKIIPKEILDLPKRGTLNVHPSLLPKLRGASPIQGAILQDERETGVTIMLLDEEVDHGPIVAQASVALEEWPPKASMLKELLAHEGGKLLAETIPQWINGTVEAEKQDHDKATFTKIMKKEDGLLNLDDDPYENFKKIQAYDEWPGTYFYVKRKDKDVRVKITDAELRSDLGEERSDGKRSDLKLVITKVVPEGKKEMLYKDFKKNKSS